MVSQTIVDFIEIRGYIRGNVISQPKIRNMISIDYYLQEIRCIGTGIFGPNQYCVTNTLTTITSNSNQSEIVQAQITQIYFKEFNSSLLKDSTFVTLSGPQVAFFNGSNM